MAKPFLKNTLLWQNHFLKYILSQSSSTAIKKGVSHEKATCCYWKVLLVSYSAGSWHIQYLMEAACVSKKTYKLQMFVKQPMGPAVQKKNNQLILKYM